MRSPGTLQSALARAIRTQHLELSRGLWTLPLTARLLPLIATLHTTWILVTRFCKGYSGPPEVLLSVLSGDAAQAFLPLLAGFSAATVAHAGHLYFQNRLQEMLREMQSLVHGLSSLRPAPPAQSPPSQA